jgi:hypothetical protein
MPAATPAVNRVEVRDDEVHIALAAPVAGATAGPSATARVPARQRRRGATGAAAWLARNCDVRADRSLGRGTLLALARQARRRAASAQAPIRRVVRDAFVHE